MTRKTVKSYERGIPDPFQSEIDRRFEQKMAKANADATVNLFRQAIGYSRKPSIVKTMIKKANEKWASWVWRW